VFPTEFYAKQCPWSKNENLEHWISERVLKLTCTANDMIPLAEAAGFEADCGAGVPPAEKKKAGKMPAPQRIYRWDPTERAELMAELDAAYLLLYGLKRDEVEYILSTFQGVSETSEGVFGRGSTADLILHHYDNLRDESETKKRYVKKECK
jgi:hypothetical protein